MRREQKEIDEQLNRAGDHHESGSIYPGMCYEEGVEAALRWVTGESDEKPMEND